MTAETAASALARRAQAKASDPAGSAWVSANAGSGKTHVLVERLTRLMLAGTEPERILCLTFTNAAAAEMANRLFARLADWAIAPDDSLKTELTALNGEQPDEGTLVRARRLFTKALESPGGLKIHTIHAFCERILHRFPLEAGVSPHFAVLDERGQRDLLVRLREEVMVEAARAPDGRLARGFATLSDLVHDLSLDDLIAQMVGRSGDLAGLDREADGSFGWALEWLGDEIGVATDLDEEALIAEEFGDGRFDAGMCRRAAEALAGGSTNDRKDAKKLASLAAAVGTGGRHVAHRAAFLRQDGIVRASMMTQAVRDAHPKLADWIDCELARAARLADAVAAIRTMEATGALLHVSHAMIERYQQAKAARGVLDYDDLIAKTSGLVSRSDEAAWVLYKLDGGIDHVLVDEAQDTSPEQWLIIRFLTDEMLAGEGAERAQRSVFVVGDDKQSIFSFQGADPAAFFTMKEHFETRATAARMRWRDIVFETSFRSVHEILVAVDAIFGSLEGAVSLGARPARHEPHRAAPGEVEIWATQKPEPTDPPTAWTVPLDYVGPADPKVALAARIAGEIRSWLDEGTRLAARGRPIRPGDIMILVRRRNAFVDAVVRELKSLHVPVAGVDRMRLTEQIAVEDLMALGRFVLLPEDDFSLACLLKSPLVGLTEEELYELAHARHGSLWAALHVAAEADPRLAAAHGRLAGWLARADFVAPHDFFAGVLCEDGRRRDMLSRLGPEAGDPVDEFLNAALAYETAGPPSLEGFLAWLGEGTTEIRRDMDHGRDEVRVMTVHGAKGLEANIVILPDTCSGPGGGIGVKLVDMEPPIDTAAVVPKLPVWPQGGGKDLCAIAAARGAADAAEMREHRRLLYVAATRARDKLIVTGYETKNGRTDGCWYDLVWRGLDGQLEAFAGPDGMTRWRLVSPSACGAPEPDEALEVHVEPVEPPAWARRPAKGSAERAALAPSRAVRDETAASRAASEAMLSPASELAGKRFTRGLAVHGLVEALAGRPQNEWQPAGQAYLDRCHPELGASVRAELIAEVTDVLALPEFSTFLGPEVRAEVPFAAHIEAPGGVVRLVEGRIDRLRLADDRIEVLDLKTHRPAPQRLEDVPDDVLGQMALYRAGLMAAFAGRDVDVQVLWTDSGTLMRLPRDLLEARLAAVLNHGAAT